MPVVKRYRSNAHRQATYRQRKPKPATQAQLATLARSLHTVIGDAIEAGTFPLPEALLAATVEETLRNLIYHFDPDKDHIRYLDRQAHNWDQANDTLTRK